MKYTSTRGGVQNVDFSTVVFSGYAPDGGLYVPQTIPIVSRETLLSWSKLNYARLTSKILSLYVNDIVREDLDTICDNAFKNFESPDEPIPIKKINNMYIVETFRGRTLAFKDIGLNILAQIMELLLIKQKSRSKANVVVETSGDTGPAAVSAVLLNTKNINIFCMFPYKQVTEIQARQLKTLMSKNNQNERIINVYQTDRNSDDQCLIIKNLLNNNKSFISKYKICAMNSINFVRIAAQMCYYFYAYLRICPSVDKSINVCIPSGAFGNTCAASFTKLMGLPLLNIIPCCNENNIVFRTLMNGDFSSSFKNYHKTLSPAMDVQVAYNMERFFWLVFNRNGNIVCDIMNSFEKDSKNMEFQYKFDNIFRNQFKKIISNSYCVADNEIKDIIKYFAINFNYLLDPHSACSLFGGLKYFYNQNNENIDIPMVCMATAHPAKFPNIIKQSFNDIDIDNNIKLKLLLKNELYHQFLPNINDKEECIQLTSNQNGNSNNDQWKNRWTEKLKNDIVKANYVQSKL